MLPAMLVDADFVADCFILDLPFGTISQVSFLASELDVCIHSFDLFVTLTETAE